MAGVELRQGPLIPTSNPRRAKSWSLTPKLAIDSRLRLLRDLPQAQHPARGDWFAQSSDIRQNPSVSTGREIAEVRFVRRQLSPLRASSHVTQAAARELHDIDQLGYSDQGSQRQRERVCIAVTPEPPAIRGHPAQLACVAWKTLGRVNRERTSVTCAPASGFDRVLADGDECSPWLGQRQCFHVSGLCSFLERLKAELPKLEARRGCSRHPWVSGPLLNRTL